MSSRAKVALFSARTTAELVALIDRGRPNRNGGPARAAIIDPTPERLARARAIAEKGKPWRGRDGMWLAPRGLLAAGGTLAFLFPGIDASFEPQVGDVARHFGWPEPPYTSPRDLEEKGIGVVGVGRLLDRVLRAIGVVPADVAGHSIGEWSGMIASGVIPESAADRFLATLEPGSLKVPGVVFAAIGCGEEQARAALRGLSSIALSHDNCPHQVILCGIEGSIDAAVARLVGDGVLCQKLPFHSGFHSPLFAGYVEPHRRNFEALPLARPNVRLWSATTCAPYPADADAIRALAVEHLVRPVRFRELIEALYERGARVFVQVGVGSLVNFVEDTLRGREHMAIAANVKERTGIDQLRRVAAALFVEGADMDFDRIDPRESAPSLPAGHPVLEEFLETMNAIVAAEREIVARFATVQERGPREATTTRELSVGALPELGDHALVRQPEGWPVLADREPVVPMTTLMDLMIEHAAAHCPGRVAVGLDDVRAHRWLGVAPPVSVAVVSRMEAGDRVHVSIGEYAEGTVLFADAYPPAPAADDLPIAGATRASLDARSLYADHWLFHGPAFQGIVDIGRLGEDGIRGTLEAKPARGALLDNAGQLFGYWMMARHDRDRMAMPVRVARVRFFGRSPRPGDRLTCTVRVSSVEERRVVGNMSLDRGGSVWAAIEGWEKRRIETDDRLWSVIRWPEKHVLSDVRSEGFVVFEDRYRSGATRERLARRYLGEIELAEFERTSPRRRRSWLAGRIAAKDAVRDLLWRLGHGPLFPVEIAIVNEPSGRPIVRTAASRDVCVSIAHKGDVAVAIARENRAVGIDIERIERRDDSFAEISFSADELRLVRDEPRDEAWTRLWSAKEAAAKAAGTGLGGSPARFPIRDRSGERLLVGDAWVNTQRHGDFIVGWMHA